MQNDSQNMIYTPKLRIPIGRCVELPDGRLGLQVKNTRTQKTDDIALDSLLSEVVKNAITTEQCRDSQKQKPAP